ncbi:hypothetical protein R1sor_018210 [Riccia sorocarpa]|uniref:Uncharacterized protein n=1 Tax=Riccia sorocarpa TaxID=122646 RepID=A0ABD3I958_9MARC
MSPPRTFFADFPYPAAKRSTSQPGILVQNSHEEDEDAEPFVAEVFSDNDGNRSSEGVPVALRRFKETLREPKPPKFRQSSNGKPQLDEIDTDTFFLSHCERQPSNGKYHLPNNFTKKEVYDHYKTDMVQVQESLQCLPFKRYWLKYYPLVTIPATNKFSVYDFCELYKSKSDKATTRTEKADAVEALKLHRKHQAEERAAAGRRRWKALDGPKDCAYIQIDGMDQKKTALAHFSKQPKSVDGDALVGVHLIGAMIFHGRLQTLRPERDVDNDEEPVAVTTAEELKRRIFGQRRPLYSGPRRPPPGSAAADRAAHIDELTEIQEKSFLAVLAEDEISF